MPMFYLPAQPSAQGCAVVAEAYRAASKKIQVAPDKRCRLFVSFHKNPMTTKAKTPEITEAAFERRLAAVTQAVDDYHTYLLYYLEGLTRQHQDAENLAQDLWQHVLLRFDEDKIRCLPLLRRKAYQLFIDHYRRQVRRGEVLTDELPEIPAPQTDYFPGTEEDEPNLRARFWSEYPTVDLTESQKEALWLHARYGFTYRKIAEQLNVPLSTVGDWIALGRKKIAAVINQELKK